MDNNKGQTIFLSVIGVATLLVAIIGATFAWFSVQITGNENASSIIITTATLGNVVFTDGNEITLSDIRPETNPAATKTFYITNTVSEVTTNFNYQIFLNVTENTLSDAANLAGVDYFTHSLGGESLSRAADANTKLVFTGDTAGVGTKAEVVVPDTVGENLLGASGHTTGVLVGTDTHKYTYTIGFYEASADQNAAQGESFRGSLQVHNAE